MLEKFTGEWNFHSAAHLLRRTTYGPRKSTITEAVALGLDESIDKLLSDPDPVDPPVYIDFEDDPQAGIGETWVDKPLDGDIQGIFFGRNKTLWPWIYNNMHSNDFNIVEKITMFWLNHFTTGGDVGPSMKWTYYSLLKDNCLGNFRDLTKDITICKAMLVYLNGNENIADEPNENYARELLELFTIGKGPLVAEGDYTNYTEKDIVAFARALTGWSPWNSEIETGFYRAWAHDDGEKQLSHRFDNRVIMGEGDQEYKTVIDIIFSKNEVAYYISRRLFTWFVNYDINDEVESEVIAPMAQIILDNDFEIKPAIKALLGSSYFYRNEIIGCMIKNPIDYLMSMTNSVEVELPQDLILNYKAWLWWHWDLDKMGFSIFQMPSVAGWKAYYQTPIFYRDWINSASLAIRKKMVNKFNWIYKETDETLQGFNFIKFIATLENPTDVNDLIQEISSILYPKPLSEAYMDFFKSSLLNNLPDFEWTVEYENYLQDPTEENRISIEDKLRDLFQVMFAIPEFQLS